MLTGRLGSTHCGTSSILRHTILAVAWSKEGEGSVSQWLSITRAGYVTTEWSRRCPGFHPMLQRGYANNVSCPSTMAMRIEPVRISILQILLRAYACRR